MRALKKTRISYLTLRDIIITCALSVSSPKKVYLSTTLPL